MTTSKSNSQEDYAIKPVIEPNKVKKVGALWRKASNGRGIKMKYVLIAWIASFVVSWIDNILIYIGTWIEDIYLYCITKIQ